jgi:hypothetical protein
VYIKIIKRRNFGFVFFIFPYSEIKNGFQDYFAQTKTKTQKEKIFFPKYTPGLVLILFHPEKNTKSIVYLSGERSAGKASTPGKNNEPRTGGEAVVSTKKGCCKKSLCKMTNKINKKIS